MLCCSYQHTKADCLLIWLFLTISCMHALLRRTFVLAVMPVRYWQEVVEVPVLLIAAFAFAKIVVIRYAHARSFACVHACLAFKRGSYSTARML